jgi:hypothetical protein
MAIVITELNEWIQTAQGQEWGNTYKAALLKNRNNLLSELKAAGGNLLEAEQRNAQTENELISERAALSKFLIDDELNRLLEKAFVAKPLIPAITRNLIDSYGITVNVSGNDRTASGKLRDKEGKEIEATLEAIVDAWKVLPESLQVRLNPNSGGELQAAVSVALIRTPRRI